jgi:ABC-2 type transport system permease protein
MPKPTSAERLTRPGGLRYQVSIAWHLSIKQWKEELAYPLTLLYFIVSPVLMLIPLLLYGYALTGGGTSAALGAITYTSDWFAYSALGFSLASLINSCLWGTGMALRREQWAGTLESLYVTPVSRFTMLFGSAIHNVQHGGLGVLLQLTIVTLAFGLRVNLVGILPALLAIALMVIGLQGFVLFFAAVVLLARRAWMAVELLVASIRLLTPMSYPIVVLPVILQVVAQGTPTYQALEAFRQFLLLGPFTPTAWTALGLLLVLDAVVVSLGWLVFRASDGFVRYHAGIGKF